MRKRNTQRLLSALPFMATQASYSRSYPTPQEGRGVSRNLFLIFAALLLLESSLLQIATTADGSEIALNPSREIQLASLAASENEDFGAHVASVQVERDEPTTKVEENSDESTPTPTPATGRLSLVSPAQAAAPAQPLNEPSLAFKSPLRSYTLTQYYSTYHTAIDMAAPYYTPIFATTHGTVVNTGYLIAGGGLMVEVAHAGGYTSYYAHMSSIAVRPGQEVNNSTTLGGVGATGWATGAHLHFMLLKGGISVNPLSLMQ